MLFWENGMNATVTNLDIKPEIKPRHMSMIRIRSSCEVDRSWSVTPALQGSESVRRLQTDSYQFETSR